MKEIAKDLKCILTRQGIEIWIEEEKVKELAKILVNSTNSMFIKYDGRLINTADITGIFTPQDMEDYTRRKNGQWKDKSGEWKDRFEKEDDPLKTFFNSVKI